MNLITHAARQDIAPRNPAAANLADDVRQAGQLG